MRPLGRQGPASCFSWASSFSNDSKTRYTIVVARINSLTRQCRVCMCNFRKKCDRPRWIVSFFFAHLPLRLLNPPLIATSLLYSLQCGRCRSWLPLILAASLGERRTDLKRLSYLFRSRERRTNATPLATRHECGNCKDADGRVNCLVEFVGELFTKCV